MIPMIKCVTFADNHWAANGGPFIFPLSIRLTSVHNDIVYDSITSLSGGQVWIAYYYTTL